MIRNTLAIIAIVTNYFCVMMALFSFSSSFQVTTEVNAFSTFPMMQKSCSKRINHLSGLLDDVMAEKEAESSSSTTTSSSTTNIDQEHEDLMYSLVFSSNTAKDIEKQFEKSTDPNFAEYLSIKVTQSQDEEEAKGLQELIDLIETVKTDLLEKEAAAALQAQKEEQEIQDSIIDSSPPAEKMSDADVLKVANTIDEAVISAALSDDEKPSDFISDCREVVNLSGGFNNNGRMRVGGG